MIPFHDLANIFPLIDGAEFDQLVADIAANGLHERIDIFDGQILDGRNRYRAAIAAGVLDGAPVEAGSATFIKFFSLFIPERQGDPVAYVISKNLRRRQLNESQRAMVAANLANIQHGGDRRSDQAANLPLEMVPQAAAAEMLNVSERSVRTAKGVKQAGIAELNRKVEVGELRISTAALIARLPKEEQARLLQEAAPDVVKAAAKEINAVARTERREKVRHLHAVLSEASAPLPQDRKYPVIYADPATKFVSGLSDRSIENHYPTESVDYWCALPVKDLALPDTLLFCWTTVPQLAATIEKILPAWGFEYKSCLCWDKTSPDHEREAATGYWARNQHELLLIAARGNPPLPEPADVPLSMYRERKGKHSAKPEFYRELIERMTPGLPRIELFARTTREGWRSWGNQSSDGGVESRHAGTATTGPSHGGPEVCRPGRNEPEAGLAPGPSDPLDDHNAEVASSAPVVPRPIQCVCGPSSKCDSPAVCAARGDCKFFPFKQPISRSAIDDLDIPAFLRRVPLKQEEMDLTQRDRLPPEVVDDALQTRLPLTDDEIEIHEALLAIEAGSAIDPEMIRHLIGAGFARATTSRVMVTDEGRAFLAQLVAPASPIKAEAQP